jgi:hypothetical protein
MGLREFESSDGCKVAWVSGGTARKRLRDTEARREVYNPADELRGCGFDDARRLTGCWLPDIRSLRPPKGGRYKVNFRASRGLRRHGFVEWPRLGLILVYLTWYLTGAENWRDWPALRGVEYVHDEPGADALRAGALPMVREPTADEVCGVLPQCGDVVGAAEIPDSRRSV